MLTTTSANTETGSRAGRMIRSALVAGLVVLALAGPAAAYEGNSWLNFGPDGSRSSHSNGTYDREFIREWESNPPRGFPTLAGANIEATKAAIKRYEGIVKAGGWKPLGSTEMQPGASGQAVVELRERLTKFGLRSFLKTSGGKGLHVTVPILPSLDWDTAKAFTKAVAQQMAADQPRRYVATMAKSRRSGRIFIDYLRNGRGATAVAPYAPRARAGAPVAMPIDWSELAAHPSAAHYTIRSARERLSALSEDPWQELPRLKQKLAL